MADDFEDLFCSDDTFDAKVLQQRRLHAGPGGSTLKTTTNDTEHDILFEITETMPEAYSERTRSDNNDANWQKMKNAETLYKEKLLTLKHGEFLPSFSDTIKKCLFIEVIDGVKKLCFLPLSGKSKGIIKPYMKEGNMRAEFLKRFRVVSQDPAHQSRNFEHKFNVTMSQLGQENAVLNQTFLLLRPDFFPTAGAPQRKQNTIPPHASAARTASASAASASAIPNDPEMTLREIADRLRCSTADVRMILLQAHNGSNHQDTVLEQSVTALANFSEAAKTQASANLQTAENQGDQHKDLMELVRLFISQGESC